MPRPRTPIAKARLSRADRKDPQRYAARSEPALSGRDIGKPPAYLPKTAKTAWATFADELPWLSYEDQGAVEIVSLMRARITDDPAGATAALFGQYRLALAALGATPVDRSKVNCRAPDDEANPFAQFSDPASQYFSLPTPIARNGVPSPFTRQ